MTEQEWLTSTDPAKMLKHLTTKRVHAVAGFGDRVPRKPPLISQRQARLWVDACRWLISKEERWVKHTLKESVHDWSVVNGWEREVPITVRAALFRCIVGNPWKPVVLPLRPRAMCPACAGSGRDQRESTDGDCPECKGTGSIPGPGHWLTPAVLSIAQTIYDDRRWEDCPILADALEEAGCSNEAMLTHLRGPEPHARGCWVLDAILVKE